MLGAPSDAGHEYTNLKVRSKVNVRGRTGCYCGAYFFTNTFCLKKKERKIDSVTVLSFLVSGCGHEI